MKKKKTKTYEEKEKRSRREENITKKKKRSRRRNTIKRPINTRRYAGPNAPPSPPLSLPAYSIISLMATQPAFECRALASHQASARETDRHSCTIGVDTLKALCARVSSGT